MTFTTALACLNHQSYNSDDWLSPHGLESKLYSWRMKWQRHLAEHGEKSLPNTLEKTLRQISSMYHNISAMVRLVATLPATTCSAERSFSSLKRIKHQSYYQSYFRATMATRLSGLSDILSIETCFSMSKQPWMNSLCAIQDGRYPERISRLTLRFARTLISPHFWTRGCTQPLNYVEHTLKHELQRLIAEC